MISFFFNVTERQTDREMYSARDRNICSWRERTRQRTIERQTTKQTGRQKDRETDKQTDKGTGR